LRVTTTYSVCPGFYVEAAASAQSFLAEFGHAYAEVGRRVDALAILDCVEV